MFEAVGLHSDNMNPPCPQTAQPCRRLGEFSLKVDIEKAHRRVSPVDNRALWTTKGRFIAGLPFIYTKELPQVSDIAWCHNFLIDFNLISIAQNYFR